MQPVCFLRSRSKIVLLIYFSGKSFTEISSKFAVVSPSIVNLSTNSITSGVVTKEAMWSPPNLSGIITLFAPANFNFLYEDSLPALLMIIQSLFN